MTITHLPFGRTGHLSSRIVFGAAALSTVTQDDADRTLEVLLEHEINHIDVAASYGEAESRIAPWLRRFPGRFFLATKSTERRAGPAREELQRSLDRLGVDHVELWQLHNLADPIEWDRALSPGGVIDAAVAAREEGLVRFIGVTGHGTQIVANHIRSLKRFDFDSVLAPFNFLTLQNRYYAENFDHLQALCVERNVAVQTIKSIAYRPWMGRDRTTSTWYEPLQEPADIRRALHWALGRNGIFVISAGDIHLLPKYLESAERFERATPDSEMRQMVDRLAMEPLFV
ncbi:MAG: aldo/keto reductase [Candidatus Handelsmanbacteria bacterium RIFCSPLOWO2_12_FULL_64_10]|uniref:Aldo/keto reductase n=1 Tax=Handelsmanbacteria sp. (strain RIFCSPLOWO2_12_FULL_64_10) TaxID=1817868 RepID=A0A1F6D338_HANXR|nr:MAG: aldo/keto reductase [Candidatus Handelsmanbacteria bacterium RIFCSPLOWO2_12_FULL_64_10]